MNNMTPQELVEKIREWEINAGESFNDCFAHDNISNTSWAFWLIGRGFKEHGNAILAEHTKPGNELHYVGQEELYDIYPTYNEYGDPKWIEENYDKNLLLMAEFLLDSAIYTKKILEWFENNK